MDGPDPRRPGASDQSFPWVDVNPCSVVEVGIRRRAVVVEHSHGPVRLSERAVGSSTFTKTIFSTAPSNPVDSLFFQAGDPSCEACAVFYCDYIRVAYGSDGKANMAWTDMRQFVSDPDFGDGYAKFIDFGRK